MINKVDVENVDIQQVTDEIEMSFGLEREQVIGVSAKTGFNVENLLERIISEVPSAKRLEEDVDYEKALKGYLVDSWFIQDQGVVMLMQVRGGSVQKGDCIVSCDSGKKYEVFEVGILHPENTPLKSLRAG